MDADFWVAAAAVVISIITFARGEVHQRRRSSEDAQRGAVESVAEALDDVLAVFEHADAMMPSSREISTVMKNFERKCERWESMLPPGARHVRVSVRQAMAHCFGPPASGAFDPDASTKSTHRFDNYWWDIGYTDLEHVTSRLGTWLVEDRRRQLQLIPYYEWRRDEDDAAKIDRAHNPTS